MSASDEEECDDEVELRSVASAEDFHDARTSLHNRAGGAAAAVLSDSDDDVNAQLASKNKLANGGPSRCDFVVGWYSYFAN